MDKRLTNSFQLHRLLSQTLKIKSSQRFKCMDTINSNKITKLPFKKHLSKKMDNCRLIKNYSPSLKQIHTDRPGVHLVTRNFFLVGRVLKIGQLSESIRFFNFFFPYLN